MRKYAARLASAVTFAMAGVLFATSAVTADGADLRATGRTNLPDLIRDREADVAALERSVAATRDRLDQLSASAESSQLDAAQSAVDELAPQAGLTEVTGPALSVTLDDSPRAPAHGEVEGGLTLDDFIVHQQDLEGVINALWAGGADAMMIMDQRVISSSSVRCVGNVLSLQGRTYSPPYTITAIGDVAGMTESLERSEPVSIYREYAEELGLGYEVSVAPAATTFPPYEGALGLRFARPAEDADAGRSEPSTAASIDTVGTAR